jgi:phenylalanyl-tRNA synthetase beta chain
VNPLSSDLNVMRQTLLLGGLEVIAYNLNRQASALKTFEYGSVYARLPEKEGTTLEGYEEHTCYALFLTGAPAKSWHSEVPKTDFFRLKGYVELLLKRFGADLYQMVSAPAPADIFSEGMVYSLPGRGKKLLTMGRINPALARRFGIKQPVYAAEIEWPALFELVKRDKVAFKELPKFPEVRRDLALLLDENVSYEKLNASALRVGKNLIRQVSLFDVYRGDKIPAGKKQYAMSFVLQDLEKTLTDADVERVMNKLLSTFQNEYGAILR